MLKKYNEGKWDEPSKESFLAINKALEETLILTSLDCTTEFLIFLLASEHNIVIVLLQWNNEGHNIRLRRDPLKNLMEFTKYPFKKAPYRSIQEGSKERRIDQENPTRSPIN